MITCTICAETVKTLGFACACKNRVCIQCEVALDKCPFCRRDYPRIVERMDITSLDEYIHSMKERDVVEVNSFKPVYELLAHFERNFFNDRCFAREIRDQIEDDEDKYMCFFNGLKEKFHEYHLKMYLFDPIVVEKILTNIYETLIEMSGDPFSIDEFCNDIIDNILRVDESYQKKEQKRIYSKESKKVRRNWKMSSKVMARKNNAKRRPSKFK